MSGTEHEHNVDTEAPEHALTDEERRRALREAVRDVEDPQSGRVTFEDVETLRDAHLTELAEIAEQYV